mgnify:CR=1 FL=1
MSAQVTVTENGVQVIVTGTLPVTAAQLAALNASAGPSADNPFATLADVNRLLSEYVGEFTIGLSRVGSLAYIS